MLAEFEKKVADFVKANELFGQAERILLAVSGGADSTALLYAMMALKDEGVFGAQLFCAHINHQLRGQEADLDEQLVIDQAGELDLPVTIKRVDVREFAHRNKLSIETSARKLRIESLLDIAKANNCNLIATAHQKNDNAETILQRLLRGTGFRGLAGIWPVRVFGDGTNPSTTSTPLSTSALRTRFVRPLLCVRRDEIVTYLQKRNLKWREDHTNADCTYTRNYIRHRLLPALQADHTGSPREIDNYDLSYSVKETNYLTGSIVEQLSQLAHQGCKLNRLVLEHINKVWPELAKTGENNIALNLKKFLSQPKIIKAELIRRSIIAIGSGERDLTGRHYEKILQLAEQPAGSRKLELPGGLTVRRESGNLFFAQRQKTSPPDKQTIESVKFEVPAQTGFDRYLIEAKILDAGKVNFEEFKSRKNNFVEWFDADKIKRPLTVRHRKEGDRFRPLGFLSEKKLGKFLTTAKVTQEIRSKLLIIADSEKIIWVWPIRISEHVKITDRTRKILQLQISDSK